jgi:hypothetical protein
MEAPLRPRPRLTAALLLCLVLSAAPAAARKPNKKEKQSLEGTKNAELLRDEAANTTAAWLKPALEAALASAGGNLGESITQRPKATRRAPVGGAAGAASGAARPKCSALLFRPSIRTRSPNVELQPGLAVSPTSKAGRSQSGILSCMRPRLRVFPTHA